MKKVNLIFFLIIITGLVLAFYASKSGYEFGNIAGFIMNSDKSELNKRMTNFLEDIQFKDFKKAAGYHTLQDQKNADIPALIENKFLIKPELMDIRDFQIQRIDIDSTGDRARIHTMTHIKLLNSSEMRDIESIFYWHKINDQWCMQLKSSL